MSTEPAELPDARPAALARFQKWAAVAVALAVLGYVAYAVWKGWGPTRDELLGFWWPIYLPVLGLTAVNYGLRYAKWAYFLRVLGISVPHRTNVWIFMAGLAMVISPAKAGEVVKPWMVRQTSGAPYTSTVPALVAERGTDGLAVVILAALSVSTYYAEASSMIFGTLATILAIVVAISVRPVAVAAIELVGKVPPLHGLSRRLLETYEATRACLAPIPFAVSMTASLVAWGAECVGYWLVFRGLGVDAPLDACTFLYAFATVFGAPSPGGMGIADAALAEGATAMLHVDAPTALAASLLVRVATLWFGVALGAVALLRTDAVISEARASQAA